MVNRKALHCTLFIFAFLFLMTCPYAYTLADGHIAYDCVDKKITKHYEKNDTRFSTVNCAAVSHVSAPGHSRVILKRTTLVIEKTAPILCSLSTVRLIL